jgi:hypothetical protein
MVFLIGFVFALPIIGFLFRFSIPISLFFFIAGTFLISILLVTDGIILNDRKETESISIVPVTTDRMNQPTGGTATNLRSGSTIIVGELVNTESSVLNFKEINQITVRLGKTGNPTGIGYFGVWSATHAPPTVANSKFIISQMLANFTSSSTIADYTFTRNDTKTYFLQRGDIIGVFFNGGSAGNTFDVYRSTTDLFDGTNSVRATSNGGTTTLDTVTDMRGKISLVEDTSLQTISYEDNVMDFSFTGTNYQLKVIMVFIAVMLMVGGALTEVRKR